VQYGEKATKAVKSFEATWRPAGGRMRVVLVREAGGWLAYFCTGPSATAAEVLEAMAGRGAIEQAFKGVKGVWGAGQQQVRNVYAGTGAFAVDLTMRSVVEAWAWGRAAEGLVGRGRCPWGAAGRRPSRADKRKALQRDILREEIQAVIRQRAGAGEFQDRVPRLLDLAA